MNRGTGMSASTVEGLEGRRHFSAVVGRNVFYNDCAFDGHSAAAAAADDGAVAAGKVALRPGETATFASVTSYNKGLNGVMIDITGLPVSASPTADDFAFRTGRSTEYSAWSSAPRPGGVTVRRGAGIGGSDRVSLVWDSYNSAAPAPTQAVANGWLEVTIRATANTGLAGSDVFYFGNLIGETGTGGGAPLVVNAIDMGLARADTGQTAAINHPADFNRDGVVNTTDVLIVRDNIFNNLPIIAPPIASSVFVIHSPTIDDLLD